VWSAVQVSVPPRPPSQSPTAAAAAAAVRPALVAPSHFTLLPPSAQYVCQPLPAPYRLVPAAPSQDLGLTYQLMAQPQASAGAVQLIPASAMYPASQHAAYLHADSAVHAADTEPIVHLSVDPKSAAAAMYGRADPAGYHVIPPSAGESYAGEMSSSVPPAGATGRLYEDNSDYYPAQSTLLVTPLHPRPVLRQPVPLIISGKCLPRRRQGRLESNVDTREGRVY